MDKLLFKAEVKKELTIRKWSYSDLSEHTRYKPSSIKTMLNSERKLSDDAMKDIATALNIKIE